VKFRFLSIAVVVAASSAAITQSITSAAASTITSGNGGSLTEIAPSGVLTFNNGVTVNPGALNQHPTIQLVPLTQPRVYPRTEQDSFSGRHEVERHQHIEHIRSIDVKK
jgi:hypothetical protein